MSASLLFDERRGAWLARTLSLRGRLTVSEDVIIDGMLDGAVDVGRHALTIWPNVHRARRPRCDYDHDSRQRDR